MRGKLLSSASLSSSSRITPAGAGKTMIYAPSRLKPQDHPRRCGENTCKKNRKGWGLGSPPQVRGKHIRSFPTRYLGRITPAGAGKTKCGNENSFRLKDHPRRCGENKNKDGKKKRTRGSPPQVRGKHYNTPVWSERCWITPAGAGKTYSSDLS